MKILYSFPVATRRDRVDYMREVAIIDAAIAHGPKGDRVTFECVETRSPVDLRRALLRCAYEIVVIAGHGPTFGLFEAARTEHRQRCASVFAEQLAACCAPNACVLLMGCCSSWLSPALAVRGLRGVSFDLPLPSAAVLAFIGAFFDGVCAGRSVELAYDFGCIAMAYDYPEQSRITRWFGPEFDPEHGHHYEWMFLPREFDDAC